MLEGSGTVTTVVLIVRVTLSKEPGVTLRSWVKEKFEAADLLAIFKLKAKRHLEANGSN